VNSEPVNAYDLNGENRVDMRRECDVLVFLESFGENCKEANKWLCLEGNRIRKGLGGSLLALSMGEPLEEASILAETGISTLYILKNDLFSEYCHEVFTRAIIQFVRELHPRLFLFVNSDMGLELAPSIAYHLETAAVTDCVDIKNKGGGLKKGGCLSFIKPAYDGQFEREISFPSGAIEIATFRREALDKGLKAERGDIKVVEKQIDITSEIIRTKTLDRIPPDFKTTDIVHAKRIIGTGAGIADKELFPVLEEFAELLQGSLGATRPVVDDGYLSKERMIGQTGKMVSPELYLSLGISGSPHHVAGIQESKRIISVNKDLRAPIFPLSDIGFIGDLKKILPELVKRIKEWRES
jgi:electron transfer flavoprotein alpha subunit